MYCIVCIIVCMNNVLNNVLNKILCKSFNHKSNCSLINYEYFKMELNLITSTYCFNQMTCNQLPPSSGC